MVPFSFKVICRNNSFSYSSILFFNNLLTYNIFNYSFYLYIWMDYCFSMYFYIFTYVRCSRFTSFCLYQAIRKLCRNYEFCNFSNVFYISALYPLWRLLDNGALFVYYLAKINPFTYGVEMVRAASQGKFIMRVFL